MWPKNGEDFTTAFVLFNSIDATVLALNELSDMKICGQRFDIKPCSFGEFDHAYQSMTDRHGRPVRSSAKVNIDAIREDILGHDRRLSRDAENRFSDDSRKRRFSPPSSYRDHLDYNHSPPRRRPGRSRSPRPRSERRRRSRERDSHKRRRSSSPHRSETKDLSIQPQQPQSRQKPDTQKEKPSICVVMSGLPPKTTVEDVEEYLKGVKYVPGMKESIFVFAIGLHLLTWLIFPLGFSIIPVYTLISLKPTLPFSRI